MNQEPKEDCFFKEIVGKLIDAFIINMGGFNESGFEDDEFDDEFEFEMNKDSIEKVEKDIKSNCNL